MLVFLTPNSWRATREPLCGSSWRGCNSAGLKEMQCGSVLGCFYCQAVDTPLNAKDAFTRPDAMEALAVVNLTATAYLLGMCPLFICMQIRLSRTLQNTPLLVREVTGTVRNIQSHDKEPSDWRGRDAPSPRCCDTCPTPSLWNWMQQT